MSKKPKKSAKNFNYQQTTALKNLLRVKTKWDLKRLYYQSGSDPQIEKDIKATESFYKRFAKKYRQSDFAANTKILKQALEELERFGKTGRASKPARYFAFRHALNAKDTEAEKQGIVIANRLKKASNEVLFFDLALGKLSKAKQDKLLKDPLLKEYRYYLERLFIEAVHDLSEAEEKILRLKSSQSCGMWVEATEKIISNRSITFKGKQIPFNTALESLDQRSSNDKPKLWKVLMTEMESVGEIAENEFTAILNDAKIDDELRSYQKPYSATAIGYEDTESSIEALVKAVSTKGFALSRRFYKAKAKLHGKTQIHYAQKYDPIKGKTPAILFEQATEICRDVFYGLKPEYGQIFDGMLQNGQIDVYPGPGKRGGAFMAGTVGLPTLVFLNNTDTFKSLETLAHEMGHAIHTERSKVQPPRYQDHSITTAETASTLFENLVFDAVYSQASPAEQLTLLHDRITRDIATIQRQIACFNAELKMHKFVRSHGAITSHELRDIMYHELKSYLGPGVNVSKEDGYSYVYWSHLRYGFYVYTYAFGLLMSTIMAKRFKQDPDYIKQIDWFLCSGRSATVQDIFKHIDIDTSKANTFETALENQEADIVTFEKLTRKSSK